MHRCSLPCVLCLANPSQVSSLPCFSLAMLPIHIIAFAPHGLSTLCLCSDSPRRGFAFFAMPPLCSDSPCSSFAFLPTANLCLCSGSPYRRGSVLGWSMLCLRRAAPCVVWLFNASAVRSYAQLFRCDANLRNAAANRYSANQRPCPT